jgi:hypothetical protein
MQSAKKFHANNIQSVYTAGYLVNCHLSIQSILIKFSKLYCNHMKQKLRHLLFTLANVNGWVTYTKYLVNMSKTTEWLRMFWRSWVKYIIQFQFCAQLMIYHTVRFNMYSTFTQKQLCCGRLSVWVEGITSLVLYIVCHWSNPSI